MTRKRILPRPEDGSDVDNLAADVLNDVLYNIIHDLVLKTHREEKMARAATAAIQVEKQAAASPDAPGDGNQDVRAETDAATYSNGQVTLKGNPLKTIKEPICLKCHLPQIHDPTPSGIIKGAKGEATKHDPSKPDPGTTHCKRVPFINQPNRDIYGQSWVPLGPGRGKKKKDFEKQNNLNADQKPTNLLSYPSATCSKCKRCILVTRLNNHMGACIGNSGRVAGRAAAQKISSANGSGANSQHEPTPPLSRRGTPIPPSANETTRKRDLSEMAGDAEVKSEADGSEPTAKKKKVKAGSVNLGVGQKIKLKTKSTTPVPIPIAGLPAGSASPLKKAKDLKDKERSGDEKRAKFTSESPIRPPTSVSPSKVPGGILKKQKAKMSSPLKKMTKMKTAPGLNRKTREGTSETT